MNTLHKAADLLENGWCRAHLAETDGEFDGAGDKFCAMGAVAAASFGLTAEDIAEDGMLENALYGFMDGLPEMKVLAETIASERPEFLNSRYPTSTVWNFNDAQTSKEPVVEMVLKAAERMDAQA